MTARIERTPALIKQTPSPASAPPATAPSPSEPAASLLARVERLIDTELGSLRAGVEPLLGELQQGLAALYPTAGGRQLPPQEQQEQRTLLMQLLDTLEDVLEALQRAARLRRHAAPSTGKGGH